MSSAPELGSLVGKAGFRNKIINGDFRINQRGYVSATATGSANQYTLDRWRVVISGQSLSFSAFQNGNQVVAPAGGIEQVIEGLEIEGGTYVLNWSGTATALVNGTARAKGEAFTLTAGENVTVRLSGGTASLVQLEMGFVDTVFERRPFALELALCQRFYCTSAGNLEYHFLPAPGATYAGTYRIMFPQPMRATPTFTPSYSNINAVSTYQLFGICNLFATHYIIAASATNAYMYFSWTASAEL